MNAEAPRLRWTPKLLLGLLVILLGIGLTLDNLRLIELDHLKRLWPALLLLVGAIKVSFSQSPAGRGVGGVLMVAGAWLLLFNLGVVAADPWDYSPLLLVALGIVLVWQGITGRSFDPAPSSSARVYGAAVMGGYGWASNSAQFEGGEVLAVMGGVQVDLRQADIAAGPAVIDAFAWWGGVEIVVPKHWSVTVRGLPIMGGFVDESEHPPAGSGPTLIVRGLAIMGGVGVTNQPG